MPDYAVLFTIISIKYSFVVYRCVQNFGLCSGKKAEIK